MLTTAAIAAFLTLVFRWIGRRRALSRQGNPTRGSG
jgi:hypothetical protein